MVAEPRDANGLQCKEGQTLQRCRRLKNRAIFDELLKTANITNKWFAIHTKKNSAGISRLGIVASKRVMSTAVSRNFAKRMIREVFRRNISADCTLDILIRVKRKLELEDSREVRMALVQILQKAQMR